MKRYGSLFERVASPDNIRRAMAKASRGKRWRRGIKETLARADEAVEDLRRLFLSGEYETSRYHSKVVYEPKRRTIYSLPFFPDRIAHHAIMNVLEPIWDRLLDEDCCSCRRGKGCHSGSTRCMSFVRKYRYVLQCDVSKFYPSLDHGIIKRIIRKKLKDARLLALLDEIVDSANTIPGAVPGKNAPIGNLLSQWFGNLYLNEMDLWLRHEVGVEAYIRYCDDFLVFSSDREWLVDLARRIAAFLGERLLLSLSKARVYRTRQGVDFLGYRHFPNYVLVRKRVARKIKRFARKAHAGGYRNFTHAQGVVASYHGLMMHANTYNLRQSIGFDELLERYGVAT